MAEPSDAPPPTGHDQTPLEIEDEFYKILAGGGRVAMLFAALDLGLDQRLAGVAGLTADEIVAQLQLHLVRGHKWVVLLRDTGILREERGAPGQPPVYKASPLLATLADGSPGSYFYREFLRYWRLSAQNPLAALLRGGEVPFQVRYPPVSWEDTVLLHDWMREGALVTLSTIETVFDFSTVKRLLDVGGGDGTMACALAAKYPDLLVTVFNLPQPAVLVRENIARAGLEGRVSVVEGDFRKVSFPAGFDLVMYSRVMADWDTETCKLLAFKAYLALVPGGRILVAEPLADENPDLAIAWEHSYLPYDDFGVDVYKPRALYQRILAGAGFRDFVAYPRGDASIHTVMIGHKAGS